MIALICKEVGTPTVAMWPGLAEMPRFNALALAGTVGGICEVLRRCESAIGSKYFRLLQATLEPVPRLRLTSFEASSHELE